MALLLLIGNLFCVFSETPEVFANSTDTGIATFADDTSLSLSIGGDAIDAQISTTAGQVAYRNHTITVTVDGSIQMENYAMSIAGPVALNGPSTFTGAGGVNPANMPNNSWGYAYGQDGDVTSMSYSSFTGSTQQIDSGTGNPNFTKNLIFAAKFANDAAPGHYTADVTLSLVAKPKILTTYTISYDANGGSGAPTAESVETADSATTFTVSSTKPTLSGRTFLGWATTDNAYYPEIAYDSGKNVTLTAANPNLTLYAVWDGTSTSFSTSSMQAMTPAICAAVKVGTSHSMTDSRGSTSYTVARLSDGRCWMTQNLRIINRTITSTDSDVSTSFTIPASALWTDELDMPHAYYNNNTTYGAYYNWYTATAGTGTQNLADSDATSSICPKGWRLPTGGGSGEFQALYNRGKSGWILNNGVIGLNGYWLGGTSSTTPGAAFFPAAGVVNSLNSTLVGDSNHGDYWSRTAYGTSYVYRLYFDGNNDGNIDPASASYYKYDGYSVRCIAR